MCICGARVRRCCRELLIVPASRVRTWTELLVIPHRCVAHHVGCAAQKPCADICVCMFFFLPYLARLVIITLRSTPHALRTLSHLAAIHLLSSLMKQSRLAQGIGVAQTRIHLERSSRGRGALMLGGTRLGSICIGRTLLENGKLLSAATAPVLKRRSVGRRQRALRLRTGTP